MYMCQAVIEWGVSNIQPALCHLEIQPEFADFLTEELGDSYLQVDRAPLAFEHSSLLQKKSHLLEKGLSPQYSMEKWKVSPNSMSLTI